MTEALLWEPSSRKVWENWEELARGKLGVTTQTLLQVEAALYLTIQNADDITRRKAQDNPAALVVSRVTGTNVRIRGVARSAARTRCYLVKLRARATRVRTPKPVPPLRVSASGFSVKAGPAMSRCTHGMSSATNS